MKRLISAAPILLLCSSASAQIGAPITDAPADAPTDRLIVVEPVAETPADAPLVEPAAESPFGGPAAAPAAAAPAAASVPAAVAPAAAAAPLALPEDTTPLPFWAPRDRNDVDAPNLADANPSLNGGTGLLRTYSATGLEPGQFGIYIYGELFKKKGFFSEDPPGTENRATDKVSRYVSHFGLSYTPIKYVEIFADLRASGTTTTSSKPEFRSNPELIMSIGDFALGVKGMYEVIDGLHVGGLVRAFVPTGGSGSGPKLKATNVDILALTTADFRDLVDIPLRLHLNTGIIIDNDRQIFPNVNLERPERFAHDIYEYNRYLLALSIDAPLPYVTPFVEWNAEFPLNDTCGAGTYDPDTGVLLPCIASDEVKKKPMSYYPGWLTYGLRSQPVSGFAITAGVSVSTATKFVAHTPQPQNWNVLLGASYNMTPGAAKIVEVPVAVEVPVEVQPVFSHVEGMIVSAEGGTPIADARISYPGTEYSDQITGPNGSFRTFDVSPGTTFRIVISHPDFVGQEMEVVVADEVVGGQIMLMPSFSGTKLTGSVSTGTRAYPTVYLRGAENYDIPVVDGSFDLEVEAGEYVLTVAAPGYESIRETVVFERGRLNREFELNALNPGKKLRFTGDGIAVEDASETTAFNGPDLSPQALSMLDDLARILAENPTLQLAVRSHTDDTEDPAAEAATTQARAQAVKDALVSRGVSAARLTTEGVGAAEPLYPNESERTRRQNNRVEFSFR